MAQLWQAAELALCRAGALTLSEVLDHAVPALLVPYPFAADAHQLHNARAFPAGCIVTEEALRPEPLLQLMEAAGEREAMRTELRKARERRSQTLADLVRGRV